MRGGLTLTCTIFKRQVRNFDAIPLQITKKGRLIMHLRAHNSHAAHAQEFANLVRWKGGRQGERAQGAKRDVLVRLRPWYEEHDHGAPLLGGGIRSTVRSHDPLPAHFASSPLAMVRLLDGCSRHAVAATHV